MAHVSGPSSQRHVYAVGLPEEQDKGGGVGKTARQVVSWIKDNNTYIPGVSSVTGIVKIAAGLLYGTFGVVQVGAGAIGCVMSTIIPGDYFSGRMYTSAIQLVSIGEKRMMVGAKEITRGAISTLPIIGNVVICGWDKLGEKIDEVARKRFPERFFSSSKDHDPLMKEIRERSLPTFLQNTLDYFNSKLESPKTIDEDML